MFERLIITGLFLMMSFPGFSQGEWNQWRFGGKIALDFSSGAPVLLPPSALRTYGSSISATVSDSLGNLLFYTGGDTIWNRNDVMMQNGNGLLGRRSPQPICVVPHIPFDNTYYLFTMGNLCHPNHFGLYYSVVDMRLAGGLGGVVAGKKNILIPSAINANNTVTATRHKNNRDVWILAQSYGQYTPFLAYKITSSGVDTVPVRSNSFTPVITGCGYGGNRFSPDGKKLFSQQYNMGMISNFDNETGVVTPLFSFDINIGIVPPYGPVGAEFSVDSKYIYISAGSNTINDYTFMTVQLDATKTDLTSFLQSAVILGYNSGNLQMAPDGKIYISPIRQWYGLTPIDSLHVINYPSAPGYSCGYVPNAVALNGQRNMGSFPNFLQKYKVYIHHQGFCQFKPIRFSIDVWPPADSIHWNFGDPASGTSNYSNLPDPVHTFQTYGQFTVKLIVRHQDKRMDTAVQVIQVLENPVPSLGPDRTFCESDSVILTTLNCPGCIYSWSNVISGQIYPAQDSVFTVTNGGTYAVTVLHPNGCENTDTANIVESPIPRVINNPLAKTICSNASTDILLLSGDTGTFFRWTASLVAGNITGFLSDSGLAINQVLLNSGTVQGTVVYHITPFIGSCAGQTVNFTVHISASGIDLGPDTSFCRGSTMLLDAGIAESYLWSTGDTSRQLVISDSGTYWARVVLLSCGQASDTIIVTENNPVINLGPDTLLCLGSTILLDAGPGETYEWSTGNTNRMIEVSQSGLYWARVTIQDCEGADTINIIRGDTLRIIDTTLCFGVPYYAGQHWQTSPGVFIDTLAVPVNCVKYHETHLNYYPGIPFGYGRDTTLCSENLVLTFFLAGGRYLWQDGSTDSAYMITKSGLYWVKTEYDNCSRQDTISVHDCPAFLLFPNAFTPNNDGLNDTFRPQGFGIEKFTMCIYNRWGAMILETDAIETGWDGTVRGQMCPEGTYIYTATYEGVPGEKQQTKGTVQLIRGIR